MANICVYQGICYCVGLIEMNNAFSVNFSNYFPNAKLVSIFSLQSKSTQLVPTFSFYLHLMGKSLSSTQLLLGLIILTEPTFENVQTCNI